MRNDHRIAVRPLLVWLLLVALLLCCGCDGEKKMKYPTATDAFYVNDFAQVLGEDTEAEMLSRSAALAEKTAAQVVVATVKTTNGEEIADYALHLGRAWGVGDSEKNNGVLIVLATEDREVYVAVGYGLEGALPDSKTGRLLDRYAVPYFSEDDWANGLLSLYKAIVSEIGLEYNLPVEEGYTPIDSIAEEEEVSGTTVLYSWIILLFLVALYLFLFRRRIPFLGGPFFFGGPRGGGFGGNFRGGSGGFGGFSGGGGSFGGGGAGRHF